MASMNRIPRFMLISGYGMGRGIHMVKARVRARIGAMMNMTRLIPSILRREY